MLETAFTKALNVVPLHGQQNVGELRHLNCCNVSYCNYFAFKMWVRYEIAMTAFILRYESSQ
uniref:hypothetical protein n=1 Tax=Succinivibrio sp. TaxID=2053619 RepID=UPI00402AB2CC